MLSRSGFGAALWVLILSSSLLVAGEIIDPTVGVRECSGGNACASPGSSINVTTTPLVFRLFADTPSGMIFGWTVDAGGNPDQPFVNMFNLQSAPWTSISFTFTNLQDRVVECPATPGVTFPYCQVYVAVTSTRLAYVGPGVLVMGELELDFGRLTDPGYFADGTWVTFETNVPEPAPLPALGLALIAAALYRRWPNSRSRAPNSGRARSDSRSASTRA
jgi:hypothetical protein